MRLGRELNLNANYYFSAGVARCSRAIGRSVPLQSGRTDGARSSQRPSAAFFTFERSRPVLRHLRLHHGLLIRTIVRHNRRVESISGATPCAHCAALLAHHSYRDPSDVTTCQLADVTRFLFFHSLPHSE